VDIDFRTGSADTVIELAGDPGNPLPAHERERILTLIGPGRRFRIGPPVRVPGRVRRTVRDLVE
jgi:hypothetical protein